MTAVYERPKRPAARDSASFTQELVEAIDTDPQVRAALLRLLAATSRTARTDQKGR